MYGDPQGDLKGLGGHCSGGGGLLPGGRGGYGRGVCRAAAAVRRSFLAAVGGERLLAFVDGFCTDWPDLTDEMYADASLHRENGAWQMIFGKHHPGLPQTGVRRAAAAAGHCRRPGPRPEGAGTDLQGGPGALLRQVRLCQRGVSGSTHGGAVWYQMRLKF